MQSSGKESEHCKDVVVWGEGVGNTNNDHGPLTEEKDRLTTELVRRSAADHGSEHHAEGEDGLCEVFEIRPITDQIPL